MPYLDAELVSMCFLGLSGTMYEFGECCIQVWPMIYLGQAEHLTVTFIAVGECF